MDPRQNVIARTRENVTFFKRLQNIKLYGTPCFKRITGTSIQTPDQHADLIRHSLTNWSASDNDIPHC